MTKETLFTESPQEQVVDPESQDRVDEGQGEVDYLDQLVGEGRKYANEKELAKAVFHAQKHIEILEREQAGLREDLSKSLKLEEVVNKMTEHNEALKATMSTPDMVDPDPAPSETNEKIKPNMSPEEIQEIVQNEIKSAEQVRTQETNVSKVKSILRDNWGSNYTQQLQKKAQELNVGNEFLDSLASNHPEAFLELVGANSNPDPVNNVAPPSSSVSIGNPSGAGQRNQNYYTNLRRTNPEAYWSPKVQMEMHDDAEKLGDSFYK